MKYTYLLFFFFLYVRGDASVTANIPDTIGFSNKVTVDQLWKGYDPRAEPLDIEIIREWKEDGVVMKIVRYRIALFKGQKAMMAAIYGYPERGSRLPGLVQIHGGGQYADYRAVLTNARRGYATISIAWAGRINAPGYVVDPHGVQLFWEKKINDPDYRLTTDWGPLDAYHAPCRNPENSFLSVAPASWTLDTVASPRNNSWFLCTMGARRALTFLEQQPEVNAEKLGVYGHSMGGKITVLTAGSDTRVKAAAPSCGGLSDRYSDNALFWATLGDDKYLQKITCPIIFLSPSNDFHGFINDLQKAVREVRSRNWRVTCSPHHNHQDTPEYLVATLLWFDQYLKGEFVFPETPKTSLTLKTKDNIPSFSVQPDLSRPILSVDIYYTQQGLENDEESMENRITRFWHHAAATRKGNTWTASLPLFSSDKPVWVYANVLYQLDKPVTGAGYYYNVYTANTCNLSSVMHVANAQQLGKAGVLASLQPSAVIETFEGDWQKEWFSYKPDDWPRRTHKLRDEQWKAPADSRLELQVRAGHSNKLVIGIDRFATEIQLAGDSQWQRFILSPSDFRTADNQVLSCWNGLKELSLSAQLTLEKKTDSGNTTRQLGGEWLGPDPQFRSLRWIVDQ